VVTGGAGFIGSHLVELLTEASAQVTVFDTLEWGERENLAGVVDDVTLLEYDSAPNWCSISGQSIRSTVGRIIVV
jgi:nucleoside-diphosphate-sugar epimerase